MLWTPAFAGATNKEVIRQNALISRVAKGGEGGAGGDGLWA
jgi:hypothetical protein